jgi:hypothetical protein
MKSTFSLCSLFSLPATLIALTTAPSAFATECRQSIRRTSDVSGFTQVNLVDYTLNELCPGISNKECHLLLQSELGKKSSLKSRILADLSGNYDLSVALGDDQSRKAADILFSYEKAMLRINESKFVEVGPTVYLKYQPVDQLFYYLQRSIGALKTEDFRIALGGGLTENTRDILSFEPGGNFSIAFYDRWHTHSFKSPTVYNAIVGDKLVVTLQKAYGKTDRVLTFPIPLNQPLVIPFSTAQKHRGLEIKVNSYFRIECRNP